MKTAQAYLRRCAESVTGFASRLRADVFLRTETILLATLLLLCVLYLTTIAVSTYFLHLETATIIVENITETVASGDFDSFEASETTVSQLNEVRTSYMLVTGGVMVAATLLFGYIAARIALVPTRNALNAQKQFIGNIAHELRTPLSILRANNEIALLEHASDSDMARTAQSNIEELDRMSGIIDNLLTLNVLFQSEHITFDYVALGTVIDQSVDTFLPLAARKDVRIEVAKNDAHVWGNRRALEQIVMNILKNAISYTDAGGSVHVSVDKPRRAYVTVEISDTGIGMERRELQRVFEPFYRIEPSRRRHRGGSGLGLTIVSELVKLHRGKIAVSSAPKLGTSIRITLPTRPRNGLAADHPNPQPAQHEINMDFRT